MPTKEKNLCRVIIPCRFSYAHVFTAVAITEGQEKKFSVSLLISKKDKETIACIQEGIEKAITQGMEKTFKSKARPVNLKLPFRDGDEERGDDPNYKGMYFINANSKQRPQIVDASINPIIDEDEFYSGCYGRASVTFYPFNTSGNKGIAAGLGNIQKLKDGEKLSGGASAEEDFADLDVDIDSDAPGADQDDF